MIVSDFHYLEDLLLRRKLHDNGELFWVDRDYSVAFRLDGQPLVFTVPVGTWTNLASIPRFVPAWVAQRIDAVEPAVIHDHLCETKPWTSRVAADVFLAAMEESGIPWVRRRAMYRAVVLFGPR